MSSRPPLTGMPRLLPYGPTAVLAEYASVDQVLAVAQRLHTTRLDGVLDGVIDVVPAARTVLVTYGADVDIGLLHRLLVEPVDVVADPATAHPPGRHTVIEVVYDGCDLDAVADARGLSVDEVVELHCGVVYTAAFCGFMPGFAYLTGLDPRLTMPRRDVPRARVPAGSVAIADNFSAVYPAVSPGGWNLLGHTDAVMWDEAKATPALVVPGSTVRFVPR